jgi:hypothetical protein
VPADGGLISATTTASTDPARLYGAPRGAGSGRRVDSPRAPKVRMGISQMENQPNDRPDVLLADDGSTFEVDAASVYLAKRGVTSCVTKGAVATRTFVEKTGARVVVVSAKFLEQVPSLPRLLELRHARSVLLIIAHSDEIDPTPVASAEVLLNASLEDLSAAVWRSLLIGG